MTSSGFTPEECAHFDGFFTDPDCALWQWRSFWIRTMNDHMRHGAWGGAEEAREEIDRLWAARN